MTKPETKIGTDKIDVPNDQASIEGFQLQSIVGMRKEAAIALLGANKRKWRIASEDGTAHFLTDDFQTGRVSLVITDGKVSSYRLG